jgi:hypothetical protein
VNWYPAVETEDNMIFVNRVTGEVIAWEVDNAKAAGGKTVSQNCPRTWEAATK